jgi:hypothetical protein
VYAVLLRRLHELCDAYGEALVFSGDPARQLDGSDYYGGRGGMRAITDFASAATAMSMIVSQGEGACTSDMAATYTGRDERELGHYQRFVELSEGRRWAVGDRLDQAPTGPEARVDFGAVRPLGHNPRLASLSLSPDARRAVVRANATYRRLLGEVHRSFNGEPSVLAGAVATMYEFGAQCEALRNIPHGNESLGPTFERVDDGSVS